MKDSAFKGGARKEGALTKRKILTDASENAHHRSFGSRAQISVAQRNDSLFGPPRLAGNTSKGQNSITMCTRGTEHTSIEATRDLDLRVNETVEADGVTSPLIQPELIPAPENTLVPSTPTG